MKVHMARFDQSGQKVTNQANADRQFFQSFGVSVPDPELQSLDQSLAQIRAAVEALDGKGELTPGQYAEAVELLDRIDDPAQPAEGGRQGAVTAALDRLRSVFSGIVAAAPLLATLPGVVALASGGGS